MSSARWAWCLVVGGEPADDILRSSRVFFEAAGAGRRAYLWRECLRDTIPRSVYLLDGLAGRRGRGGALVGGWLGSVLGLRPAMWVVTAGIALVALAVLASPLGRLRTMPSREADPVQR